MADAEDAETGGEKAGEAGGEKDGKSKLIIIIVAVVLLLGLGGGGAYFLGALGGGGDAEAAKVATPEAQGSHGGQQQGQAGRSRVSLDTFVVNLADEGAQRYLKVTMMVEFFGNEPPPQFSVRQPEVRDLLLTLLSSKYVADIRTIEGKQQLRDEVIARINRVLDDDVVKAIYFADFIVQ
jgi:flagellar protein FliL